jgi:arachidonate 15-lipoxygenase
MKHWNAINKFVKEILGIYYKSDADVKEDHELQSWANELSAAYGPSKFPTSVETLEKLVVLASIFIFNSAVSHSVLNFAQFESFGFIPNSPSSLFVAPPGTWHSIWF